MANLLWPSVLILQFCLTCIVASGTRRDVDPCDTRCTGDKKLKYDFSTINCSSVDNTEIIAILEGGEQENLKKSCKSVCHKVTDSSAIFNWYIPNNIDEYCCWSISNVRVVQGIDSLEIAVCPLVITSTNNSFCGRKEKQKVLTSPQIKFKKKDQSRRSTKTKMENDMLSIEMSCSAQFSTITSQTSSDTSSTTMSPFDSPSSTISPLTQLDSPSSTMSSFDSPSSTISPLTQLDSPSSIMSSFNSPSPTIISPQLDSPSPSMSPFSSPSPTMSPFDSPSSTVSSLTQLDSPSPTMSPFGSPSPTISPLMQLDSPSPTMSPFGSPSPTISPLTQLDSPFPTISPFDSPSPTISPFDSPSSTISPLTQLDSPSPTMSPFGSPSSTIISPLVQLDSPSPTMFSIDSPSPIISPLAQSNSTSSIMSQLATLTGSLIPTATVIPHCPGDGSIWFDTLEGCNITSTCYKGTVNATICCESGIWDNCHTSPVFDTILSQTSTMKSLRMLIATNDIPLNQRLYLFESIIANRQVLRDNIELALTIANDIFNSGQKELRNSIITQLLLMLDTLALNSLETNLSLSVDNIVLRIQEVVFPLADDKIVGINVENNSIQLPSDISLTMNDTIKIVSFVFHNLSQLLSPQTNKRRLISPVISATCINCKKTDLNPQVNISFNLSSQKISPNDALICVFLNISESNDSLPTSDWSTEGCKQSSYQKENSIITCQCDHLTHFAILLSPRAPDGDVHDDILTVVGYVLTPISLVCMLLVIFTYACMKSLWNMRNYIHIMLCINLFIAQLLFVVGIGRTEYLPVCSVIAVIIQYMYLVSFMWMLMEGVVLYVALVRVFIKHPKRYIAAFTISSYGIPALYMMIVIPIGFLAGGDHTYYLYYNSNITDRQTNYSTMINGNNDDVVACWLDYESGFVFTFIVPVIAIILVNCGFFIMAIVIMWKQKKKNTANGNAADIKHWLKASISLTIVMGIGWIFNILFFARELLFVAYIMTVFIAGQGIVIFIMYVPCSKHVRNAYFNWLRKKQANSSFWSKFTFIDSKLSKLASEQNYSFEKKENNFVSPAENHGESLKSITEFKLSEIYQNNHIKDA